jgi:hypothetical protein
MSRHHSYSYIYNVQRMILLVFYTTTALALSIPITMGMMRLVPDQFFPVFIVLILYLVGVIVLGCLIHVISYIPFNLATSFDPIKNEIASREIQSMDQLGKRITEFTVNFFDFSFLDITHAYMETADSGLISHEEHKGLEKVLEAYQMLEKSQELDEVIHAGEINLPEGAYQLYILPIWLGEHWLGYMALLSEKRISHFFLRFLSEYENNFLDDQIMHIVHFTEME